MRLIRQQVLISLEGQVERAICMDWTNAIILTEVENVDVWTGTIWCLVENEKFIVHKNDGVKKSEKVAKKIMKSWRRRKLS